MAVLHIQPNHDVLIEINARESNEYDRMAYLKFTMNERGCHEMFMAPESLRQLGYFLVNEAKMIEAEQKSRMN